MALADEVSIVCGYREPLSPVSHLRPELSSIIRISRGSKKLGVICDRDCSVLQLYTLLFHSHLYGTEPGKRT